MFNFPTKCFEFAASNPFFCVADKNHNLWSYAEKYSVEIFSSGNNKPKSLAVIGVESDYAVGVVERIAV